MYINMKQCALAGACIPFKHVFHIGAHGGEEAKDYQDSGVQSVAWVEGNPELMPMLKEKTAKFEALNQCYVPACMSDVNGEEITFNVANNGQSSSILELGTHATLYPHIKYTKSLKVKAYRMDKLIDDKGFLGEFSTNWKDVDFLNLDVQGAELKVLKGFGDLLHSPGLKAIYTEVNFEKVYKDCCLASDLDQYLAQFGFKRIVTAAPEKTWGDSLYCRV